MWCVPSAPQEAAVLPVQHRAALHVHQHHDDPRLLPTRRLGGEGLPRGDGAPGARRIPPHRRRVYAGAVGNRPSPRFTHSTHTDEHSHTRARARPCTQPYCHQTRSHAHTLTHTIFTHTHTHTHTRLDARTHTTLTRTHRSHVPSDRDLKPICRFHKETIDHPQIRIFSFSPL